MFDFIATHKYDLILLVVFVFFLVRFLLKNKAVEQKLLALGKFPIFSIFMVRKQWGIDLMKKLGERHPYLVKGFGYLSIGIGVLGLFLNIFLLVFMIKTMIAQPAMTQVGLVLPFTNIPGLGYLSFTHWIIAIAFLATIHEFAHGVVAKAHKLRVKSSGVAVFSVFRIPFIPAAFVEPDEVKMKAAPHRVQHSVLAAGPTINILVAIPLWLLLIFTAGVVSDITEPVGFSFMDVNESLPAANAGIEPGFIYSQIDGVDVLDANALVTALDKKPAGGRIILGNGTHDFPITTVASPTNKSRAYIGVIGLINERDFQEPYKPYSELILWTQELIKWLFLFNFLVGLMNLMPLFITDGGQIVRLYAQKLLPEKYAGKAYVWICNITLLILLAAFFIPMFL